MPETNIATVAPVSFTPTELKTVKKILEKAIKETAESLNRETELKELENILQKIEQA